MPTRRDLVILLTSARAHALRDEPNAACVTALATPIRRPPRTWPRSFAALEVRNYRMYLSAQAVAVIGLWMQRIAQDWMVLQMTGSVTAVGIAVALQFAPMLFFGLVGGVIADRFDKRKILITTQSIAATMALLLGTLALTGTVRVWHVFAIALTLGFVTVVDNPSRQVFVSELVGTQHIGNAVSLNSSVFQLGALVGPALSGLLINAVGEGWSFLINGCACSLVVIMLVLIRPTAGQAATIAHRARGQLREGLRYIRHTSAVAWTVLLVGVMGVFGLNMPVYLAAYANNEFKLGVSGYSLFNSMLAVGALSGALISARRNTQVRLRGLVAAMALTSICFVAAASAPHTWMFMIVLVGIGVATMTFFIGANSLVQTTAAPAVRGRVMSVYLIVNLGGQSLGSPLVGRMIDLMGPRASMFLCGSVVAAGAITMGLLMAHTANLRLRIRRDVRRPVRIVAAH